MAVTLLPLANGRVSLEFERSDMASVASAIRGRYGLPAMLRHATSVEYRFGGCSFAFQDEWDDPCLISGSAEGDKILGELSRALNSAR